MSIVEDLEATALEGVLEVETGLFISTLPSIRDDFVNLSFIGEHDRSNDNLGQNGDSEEEDVEAQDNAVFLVGTATTEE